MVKPMDDHVIGWRCFVCGKDLPPPSRPGIYKCLACAGTALRPADSPPKPGLGDMVAAGLDAVGITKDRVQAVARRVGIKDCGCKRRQQKLNELGEKLGIGR